MTQLTIRGLEPRLEESLRRIARQERISLNKAALRLLRRGAGMPEAGTDTGIGEALDGWVGNLSAADRRAVENAVAELDRVSLSDS